ncbi:MAG: glycosyltransferase family 4 protein [Cyclobacteriaceae bacterium]
MKILFLHSSSDLYGASRIFLQTIREFKKNGISPVVVLSGLGPLSDELEKIKVPVHVVRLGVIRRRYMSPIGIINRIVYLLIAVKKLKKLILSENIDVVYNNASSIFSGLIVSKICRVPHLWHVHEIIVNPKWFAKFISWLLDKSDKVVAVSAATADHWKNLNKSLANKLEVVHNGLSPEYIESPGVNGFKSVQDGFPTNTIWIGMIARVHFWKGQQYFLELARQIANKYENAMFLMAGDAFPGYEYLYDEIDKKIIELDLAERIVDLKYVEDSSKFFGAIDILIVPSILPDPLPTTCLEAMANGLPVIATNHGGATEMVVDGKTGFLIPWDDPVLAFDKIVPLLGSDKKRNEFGKNGRDRINDFFTEATYISKMMDVVTKMKK